MYLIEHTPIETDSLPLADLRGHLRLGTGFADDTLQDGLIERTLRAAIAEIERLTGRALIHRRFALKLQDWSGSDRQVLPRAPVTGVLEIAFRRQDATREVVDRNRFRLERDDARPSIRATGFLLPAIPVGAEAEVDFSAGYGGDWGNVPEDLALAAIMLAATRYEDRQGDLGLPDGVRVLIAPYRQLRLARAV